MIVFDSPVHPDALTGFVRELPEPANLVLSAAMPTQNVQSQTVNFAERVHTNRTAKFRAFDGAINTMARDGGSEHEVSLLPLSNSLNMGEFERLQVQFARLQGGNKGALVDAIYNDAENLVASVRNRIEMAWGDVLADGKLTINENGYVGEADFGVPENHVVTAGADWLDPDTEVLEDLLAWSDVYSDTPGNGEAGAVRTSRKILRALTRNKQLINAIKGTNNGLFGRVSLADINDLLDSEGLPRLTELTSLKLDVDGVATAVMPEDKVLLTPANLGDLGYTAYGLSATALELTGSNLSELDFSDAPGIVGVVIKEGVPFRQFTFVDATAMPILSQPKRLFIATATGV